jgi:hypothetical protein
MAGDLRAAIQRAGYYPELVAESIDTALAGQPVVSWLVHHEAAFDRDELRRHVTVLALSPTRLVVSHTDDHPADADNPTPSATTSTETVAVRQIGSVVVSRTVADPVRHVTGTLPREVVLTVGWGAVSRLDLEPATCGDPECGYTGASTADDLSVRISAEGDGEDAVAQALEFARALSAATTAVQ